MTQLLTRTMVTGKFNRVVAVYLRGLKLLAVCFFSFLSLFAQICLAQSGTTSDPEANPGRPTVSTPATLTPVGYLQFENGVLFAEHSTEFSRRNGIGQVTKLAVLPRVELFLQSEPLTISEFQGQTAVHEGEVSQTRKLFFIRVGNRNRPCRLAIRGEFTRALRPNSTLALFDNRLRFFSVRICTDFTSIRTGSLRNRLRKICVEHSLDKPCPSLMPLESSRFPARYGISHSHSKMATPSVASGRFLARFARIW